MDFRDYMYNLIFGAAGKALAGPEKKALNTEQFDPFGSGYDESTGAELSRMYPLTVPKPESYQGDTVRNEGAFEAWVWHPDKGAYFKHSSSRDPRTGMILKGAKHPTWDLMMKEDKKLGYKLIFKDGRYYSVPANSQRDQISEMDRVLNALKLWKGLK